MKRFSGEARRFFVVFIFSILCVFASLREIEAQVLPKETEAKIRAVLNSPQLKDAHVGLSILDLGTVKDAQSFPAKAPIGKPFRVLFESDADKKFMPASNMKLFTAAIALELLGKEKTFRTEVFHRLSSELFRTEDLGLLGYGDPSLNDDGLKRLATQIREAGITEVGAIWADGNIYGAETTYWQYPYGWTMDDTKWYYGPAISAIAYNRNQADVNVVGAAEVHHPAKLDSPMNFPVSASVETIESIASSTDVEGLLRVERVGGRNGQVWIFGQLPVNRSVKLGLAVPDPAGWAASSFSDHLAGAGVKSGTVGTLPPAINFPPRRDYDDFPGKVIASIYSPPLKVLFQRLLKNSDNLYAEMLLRNAAYYHDGTGGDKAGPRAHALLKKWLIAQSIDTSGLRFEDGSGLSRYNLLTPRVTSELLAAINRMKDGDVIWNALPIAGIDGTMKKRMLSTPTLGNVRAKSGTFSIASNLSGYVTTRNNRRLAVALFINFARNTKAAQKAQDEIFAILAASALPTRNDVAPVKAAFDEN